MRDRVEKLMDGERKEVILNAIKENITPEQAISVNCLIGTGPIGKSSADGFDRITEEIPLEFPKDHFTHNNVALEWYMGGGYLKCVKIDSNGNQLGDPIHFSCIFCFFFRRIEPGNQKMILETHFSLVTKNKTHVQSEPVAVWNYNNSLELPDPEVGKFVIKSKNLQLLTLQEGENYLDDLNVSGKDEKKGIAIDFKLKKIDPFVLQAGNGYMGDLKNGIAYGYYSAPLFKTTGTLKYHNEDYLVLDGSFGIDHEWGTIGRPLTKRLQNICDFLYALGLKFRFLDSGFGLYGYESWFGFHFDDGSFITTVAAGVKPLAVNKFFTPKPPLSQYLNPDGKQIPLPDLKLRILGFAELDGSKYPNKFEFTNTPLGDFFITTLTHDQRMEWAGGGYAYEGGVLITDRSGKQIGIGNLENCGWDDKFTENVLNKLGIDKSKADLFNSRSKKRGALVAVRFFSILSAIITFSAWGLTLIFS
jgi:hypothetical protein